MTKTTARVLNEAEYWGRVLECRQCGHVQVSGPSDGRNLCHQCSTPLTFRATILPRDATKN